MKNLAISAMKFAIELIENDVANNENPKIGTVMPDGMIYAGISPETQKPFYICSESADKQMNWTDALKYAEEKNLSLPTKEEATCLYRWHKEIGGFRSDDYYWTSTEYSNGGACYQTFSTGSQGTNYKYNALYVRCVRR